MAERVVEKKPRFWLRLMAGATNGELIARLALGWALAIGVSLAASAAGAWIGH